MNKQTCLKSRVVSLLVASLLSFSTTISHGFDFDTPPIIIDFDTLILAPVFTPEYPLVIPFTINPPSLSLLTLDYPRVNPVAINPSLLSLTLDPALQYEISTGYDPTESHAAEIAQQGFLLLDGTLAFTVQAVDEAGGRRGIRARARVRVEFEPASLRARARARGRMGARAGNITNELLMRKARLMRYDEDGAQWVRAVSSIRSPGGRRAIEFKRGDALIVGARGRTLGQHGNFYDDATNTAYVWAVLDTNSKYAAGVSQLLDADDDALYDEDDNCPSTANPSQQDTDADGIGDVCDADLDGDGAVNELDNCPGVSNVGQEDTDGDLVGDACDADDDDDNIADGADNCPLIPNADQVDTDSDNKGDVCDADLDGDGVANETDNCPVVANGGQSDFDYDSTGDACDSDIDGDSVANADDTCEFSASGAVVNPNDGCSIEQSCPCEGPRGSTEAWRNHGKYVSCTTKAANALKKMDLIMDFEKADIVSVAAASACGMK